MNNFTLVQKTKMIFGKDTEKQVGAEVKKYSDKCLIVHDGGAYLTKLLETVKESLKEAGVEYFELSGVRANPLMSLSNKGIEMCRENGIEFVLAVGGGSVMDTGKYIAVGVNCPFPAIEFNPMTVSNHKVLHHGAISTLSGTGSEFSACSMMVNDSVVPNVKACLINDVFFNDFAIVNPELTYTLPAKQTACGAMDIMSHSWETYFTEDETGDLSDYYFEGVVKTVLKYAPVAVKNPTDYTARANLCLASNLAMVPSMSYAGMTGDWPVHAVENPVTTTYHRTHGEILGIMTLAYVKFALKQNHGVKKLIKWAVDCMGANMNYYQPEATVLAGVKNLETWLKSIGLPTTLSEIGVDYKELRPCAERCVPAGYVSRWNADQVMEIYELAK